MSQERSVAAAQREFWFQYRLRKLEQYPWARLKEADSMRTAAQSLETEEGAPFLYSTERMEQLWDSVYASSAALFNHLKILVQGYLTLLEVDFAPLDSVDNLVAEIQSNLDLLLLFGAKPSLAPVLEELKLHFKAEPDNNLDRGAYVCLLEALFRCLPYLPPLRVKSKLEEHLGHKTDPRKLVVFSTELQKPTAPAWFRQLSSVFCKPDFSKMVVFQELDQRIQTARLQLIRKIATWKIQFRFEGVPNGTPISPGHPAYDLLMDNGLQGVEYVFDGRAASILQITSTETLQDSIIGASCWLKSKRARDVPDLLAGPTANGFGPPSGGSDVEEPGTGRSMCKARKRRCHKPAEN